MILVDTGIWIDHIRYGDPILDRLLDDRMVAMHPFVIAELALGSLGQRDAVLTELDRLPEAMLADRSEVRTLIERHKLYGTGIGYVDAHLLAATLLSGGAALWTRDKRLRQVAGRLGVDARLDQ